MNEKNENLEEIVKALSALSILDMSKLKTLLEETWNVKAASGIAAGGVAPAVAATVAEPTEFEVTLEKSAADKMIGIIKVIREILGLGLKDAKDLFDGAPRALKSPCSKAEAEEIVKKITAAGGQATTKAL